eukprot:4544233-Pyramimonas_sp.AAC.1
MLSDAAGELVELLETILASTLASHATWQRQLLRAAVEELAAIPVEPVAIVPARTEASGNALLESPWTTL